MSNKPSALITSTPEELAAALDDVSFAIQFVHHLSGRSNDPAVRLRAAHMMSAVQLLDAKLPTWREDVAALMLASGRATRRISETLVLPEVDESAALELVTAAFGVSQKGVM